SRLAGPLRVRSFGLADARLSGLRFEQPGRDLDVLRAHAPCDGLGDGPEPRALAVETELAGQPVDPTAYVSAAVTELGAADDRCDCELALAGERLRVDREPRLSGRAQDVARMEVLVQKNLL